MQDLSGVPVAANVPSPDPAPAPPTPPAVAVVEAATAPLLQTPVAAPSAAAPTLTKELTGAIDGIVSDLSGVSASSLTVGDLLRFVPRLASLVHTLQIRGSEKRDLVIAAAHALVDRVFGESDRPATHALVDVVFPHAIAGVIDVVAGRVTFQQAAAAAVSAASTPANQVVVAQAATNCFSQVLACLGKK